MPGKTQWLELLEEGFPVHLCCFCCLFVVAIVCHHCCCYCRPFLLLVSLPLPASSPLTPGPMVLLQKKRERRMERTALREWDLAGPLSSATPTKPSLCLHTPAFLFSPTQTGMCAPGCVDVYLCVCVYVGVWVSIRQDTNDTFFSVSRCFSFIFFPLQVFYNLDIIQGEWVLVMSWQDRIVIAVMLSQIVHSVIKHCMNSVT